ncbi:MAG: SDR family NAD(P)-dependent oxidoreductase [Parvibaculaceae bacterium]
MQLAGQIALVTGAARGIGAECACELARHGAMVICSDILPLDNIVARIAAQGGNADCTSCNIADERQTISLIEAAMKTHGRIDHLVHCAGIVIEKPLLETTAADFDRVTSVNLRGSFLIGRAALRVMNRGSATFIASDLAYLGRANHSAYVASKHGVLGLVRSWAHEFAPAIRVNAICPGPTNTEMTSSANLSAEAREKELALPMRRFAEPSEIAAMAGFLASSSASFITGQGIGVNGGSVMP